MFTPERFEEVVKGIDYHCHELYKSIHALQDLKQFMHQYVNSERKDLNWKISKLESKIDQLTTDLQKRGLPKNQEYEVQYESLKNDIGNIPQAVNPENICSEDERDLYTKNILNLVIAQDLKDLNFLDYGCGNSHLVQNCNAKIAIGYDIKASEGVVTNFDEVKKHKFDVVLMHDVLDHTENMTPIEALRQAKSVLKSDGKIYIKNHPWCSRHGGHLYKDINKAYLHLIFDERELMRVGGWQSTNTLKIYEPIQEYQVWFEKAGFEITNMQTIESPVEDYFKEPSSVRERLLTYWGNNESKMIRNMEIEFVEYTLKIKKQQMF